MKRLSWAGYTVEADGEATREWYAGAEEWGCDCGHCRNFLALAKERKLPEEILGCLDELGIPPEKCTELSELYDQDGKLPYDLHYRVAGRLLARPPEDAPRSENSLWCGDEHFYPYGAEDFPEPCFDLCFSPWLPWVLDEPIDGRKEGEP